MENLHSKNYDAPKSDVFLEEGEDPRSNDSSMYWRPISIEHFHLFLQYLSHQYDKELSKLHPHIYH